MRAGAAVGVLLALAVASLVTACDAVDPAPEEVLVVEAFLDAGAPLPEVVVRRTRPLSEPHADDLVADAEVLLRLEGRDVAYRPAPGRPGRYAPADAEGVVPPGASFSFEARWGAHVATASGTVPPRVRIEDVHIEAGEMPVLAVLLDSLVLDPSLPDSIRLDSLGPGADVAYVYPVEVTLRWTADAETGGPGAELWVRTQLRAPEALTSSRINFFLHPEQIQPEANVSLDAGGLRTWTGVYAVLVDGPEDPLPPHRLRVALLRSGPDYARYAASRDAPGRREPLSNVSGGTGIVAGVSVDSLGLDVP